MGLISSGSRSLWLTRSMMTRTLWRHWATSHWGGAISTNARTKSVARSLCNQNRERISQRLKDSSFQLDHPWTSVLQEQNSPQLALRAQWCSMLLASPLKMKESQSMKRSSRPTSTGTHLKPKARTGSIWLNPNLTILASSFPALKISTKEGGL